MSRTKDTSVVAADPTKSAVSAGTENKRVRSKKDDPAVDVGKQSKRLKTHVAKGGNKPSVPGAEKSLTEYMRLWLTEASNTELDKLLA